jgi:putative spermidine/putrescine transport system permease protein
VVTLFTAGTVQTLPIWIFNHIHLPRARPIVNVVAMAVLLLSVIPVYFAQRLTREPAPTRASDVGGEGAP